MLGFYITIGYVVVCMAIGHLVAKFSKTHSLEDDFPKLVLCWILALIIFGFLWRYA